MYDPPDLYQMPVIEQTADEDAGQWLNRVLDAGRMRRSRVLVAVAAGRLPSSPVELNKYLEPKGGE